MANRPFLIERTIQTLSVVMLCSAITFFVYTAHAETTPFCHTLTSTSDIPVKYGAPYNLFSKANELLMKATCADGGAVMVTVGTGDTSQYIYKYGYRKIDGGKWLKTSFFGSKTVGSWFVGNAATSFRSDAGESGKVLAYICQRVSGAWKCGCSDTACGIAKWNLQEYKLAESTDDNEEEDEGPAEGLDDTHFDFNIPEHIDLINKYKDEILNGSYEEYFDVQAPSKYVALPGEKLLLTGVNFDTKANNDILWNGEVVESNLVSKNGMMLNITVPNLPPGKYEIYVRKGTKLTEYPTYIWIGTGVGPTPKVFSITPEVGAQGDEFTIHGEGFTNNNDVITTFGILKGLKSEDGKTITFTYDPFEEPAIFYNEQGGQYNLKWPVTVIIVNTSGVSEAGKFYLNA